jgi:hypothetical protein
MLPLSHISCCYYFNEFYLKTLDEDVLFNDLVLLDCNYFLSLVLVVLVNLDVEGDLLYK